MTAETTTATLRRMQVREAMIKQEGNTKVAVVLAVLITETAEAESEAIVAKFQDAYDALFRALGGRPNGEGAADVRH